MEYQLGFLFPKNIITSKGSVRDVSDGIEVIQFWMTLSPLLAGVPHVDREASLSKDGVADSLEQSVGKPDAVLSLQVKSVDSVDINDHSVATL